MIQLALLQSVIKIPFANRTSRLRAGESRSPTAVGDPQDVTQKYCLPIWMSTAVHAELCSGSSSFGNSPAVPNSGRATCAGSKRRRAFHSEYFWNSLHGLRAPSAALLCHFLSVPTIHGSTPFCPQPSWTAGLASCENLDFFLITRNLLKRRSHFCSCGGFRSEALPVVLHYTTGAVSTTGRTLGPRAENGSASPVRGSW